ncbi:MAG: anti-sigma factor [Planctomycetota bacterium]
MDCDEVRELLSPYLDRELTPDEMTRIAEHLESCPDCMHKSTIFGQLSKVIKHWEGIQASEEARRKLVERVRTMSTRDGLRRTFPVALLVLLAGALLIGGATALAVWVLRGTGEGGGRGPAAVECVHKVNKAEVVVDGAPILIEGRRRIYPGQDLRCNLGAAVQIRWPAEGRAAANLVLRGPGALKVVDASSFQLESGTLVFDVPAAPPSGGGGPRIRAGSWEITLPAGGCRGLAELTPGGGLRVASRTGAIRLGPGGPEVLPGKERTIESGGALSPPKDVADPRIFDMLVGR